MYPTTDSARAQEFVGASHARPDRVREMLAGDVGLTRAAWDWGFGDWETAIGAASHTGNKEILEILIGHGARPDLFTLATLDRVDAVRAVIEGVPGARGLEGPHSISLYAHAEAGEAQRVLEYLSSVGIGPTNLFETERGAVEPYLGEYTWGPGELDRFRIGWNERRSVATIERPGLPPRNMMPLGGHAFSPAGARHVVIRFGMEGERATLLSVEGFGTPLRAERLAG
ncbi:MAG: hypothetical protein IPJ41_16900 [Phycisphaerales bacterium]|nr:hypothetical protein [Phycisphaerales bacterium]